MHTSFLRKFGFGVAVSGIVLGLPLWAQQVSLSSLQVKVAASPTPYTFVELTPGIWTLPLPAPEIDIHGKATFIGTFTVLSLDPLDLPDPGPPAFAGGMQLDTLSPSFVGAIPTWFTGWDMEESLNTGAAPLYNSFYYDWTIPASPPRLLVGQQWQGTLFSIWLDGVALDTPPVDALSITFDVQDRHNNNVFAGSSGAAGQASFNVGDYTSPSLNIGAPEPGTVALALCALVVVGVQFLLNLRKRRQAVAVAGSR